MNDLNNLRVQAQRLKDDGARYVPIDPASVLGLLDQLEAAQVKANRYDYLTQQFGDYCITDAMENTSGVYKAAAADHVIDEAMQSTN